MSHERNLSTQPPLHKTSAAIEINPNMHLP